MKRKEGFADLIFRGAGPFRLKLAAYALGVLASGILGEFLYQFLTDVLPATGIRLRGTSFLLLMVALPPISVPLGILFLAQALVETVQLLSAGQIIALAAIFALYLAGYVLYRLDQRQARSAHTTFDESRLAPPHQGVVWILGPSPFDHLLFALRHHIAGGSGQHCWLIMQKGNREVEQRLVELERKLQEEGLPTILHPERIQDVDAQSAYRAVRSIYEEKAPKAGVPADQLIAVLTVAPTEPITAPAVLGRAVHAWALGRIASVDSALAQRLHEGSDLRPLTASNLWGTGRAQDGRVSLDPERPCWLRVTTLTEETSAALERGLPAPGEPLILGDARLMVQEAATDATQHPWAGRASYTDLMQRYTLAAGATPRSVALRFASPTLFRSHDRDFPLPLPDLVFGSYLRKWNSFSPLTLPEDALRYASECVALGRFRLHSRLISFEQSDKGAHVGFTGEAHFRFLVGDAYWTRLMRLLAGYAFWCGTGYRTTAGLGQTQMVEERKTSED